MAVTFIEGFDTYNGVGGSGATTVGLTSRWAGDVRNTSMSAGTPYNRGQSLLLPFNSNYHAVSTTIPSASSGTVGFYFYATGYLFSMGLFMVATGPGTIDNNSTRQMSINLNNNGTLSVGTGTSTFPTVIYTTTNIIPLNVWNFLEVEFTISNTVGAVSIYLNGALFGSATGLDTQTQASATFNTLVLGDYDVDVPGSVVYYDDVYVTDTPTRLGESRVITVVPSSDGTPSQWAASGGAVAPYTMVDEVLCNGDADYIFDGTVNDRAVFNMASTGLTPASVSAVQIGTFSRKTDTGVRAIQLQYVDSGGTAYNSSDISLTPAYGRQVSILENNPATATAWTPAEANALKTGVKVSV